MSISAAEELVNYEPNLRYVERLIYDVLAYTLEDFGLPMANIPTTDCEANIYKRPNLLWEAIATVLLVSFSERKILIEMLKSHVKNTKFRKESIGILYKQLLVCCVRRNRCEGIKNKIVVLSIALCNEIILFFDYKQLNIDIKNLVKSVSKSIVAAIGPDKNVSETIEESFIEFDDLKEFGIWITDFIVAFAIPYGSKDHSNLFDKCFKLRWKSEIVESECPELQIKERIKSRVLIETIPPMPIDRNSPETPKLFESSGHLQIKENIKPRLLIETVPFRPIGFNSSETPKLLESSGTNAQGKAKMNSRPSRGNDRRPSRGNDGRPSNVSYQRIKAARIAAQSIKEKEAKEMDMESKGVSQESSGAIRKLNTQDKKEIQSRVRIHGYLVFDRNPLGHHDSPISQKVPESPESIDRRQRKSTESQTTHETERSGRSTENSSDLGVEDVLEQMNLKDETTSKTKNGAIANKKTYNKKSKKSRKK